jgi:hypothetical protein
MDDFCSMTGGLNDFDYVLPLACLTASVHTCLTGVNFLPSDNYNKTIIKAILLGVRFPSLVLSLDFGDNITHH